MGTNEDVSPERVEVSTGFCHLRGSRPAHGAPHVSAEASDLALVRRIAVSEPPNNYAHLLRSVTETLLPVSVLVSSQSLEGAKMTTDQILVVGRVVERLLICLFGGLSLALGWNLFRVGVLDQQSASLETTGWRVELKRVGPGTFFALFGCVVLAISLHSPLTLGPEIRTLTPSPTDKPVANTGQRQYGVDVDPTIAKQWVASLNTVFAIATPDKFQSSEKQAIGRSVADLTNLRNALVMKQFGSDRFAEYESTKSRFDQDPSALSPSERARLQEIADWMKATRTLE
jgi:hypothetical protein